MNFEKYVAKGNLFVKEVAEELGHPDDRHRAARVMRAVLHAMRRRLTLEESFDLLAQLPMCIKAVYVDGWKPSLQPEKIRHIDDFIDTVMEEDGRTAAKDFATREEAIQAAKAVFRVIKRHVSDGEIQDVTSSLPKQLRALWEEETPVA